MYTAVLIKDKRTHLGVADGELELGHRQLRGLAVSVGSADHPVHQGRGGGFGDPLRREGRAARRGGNSRWRAVPLRGRPLDGPSLAGTAADPDVRRHLLQDRCPRVAEPPAAPAAERPDEQAGGGVVDKAHSPRTKFNNQVSSKYCLIEIHR